MSLLITVSKSELKKYPQAELLFAVLTEKVSEINKLNIYIIQDPEKLSQLVCFLRDSKIVFGFYGNESELIEILSSSSRPKLK